MKQNKEIKNKCMHIQQTDFEKDTKKSDEQKCIEKRQSLQ
jgi:hypothetical protein